MSGQIHIGIPQRSYGHHTSMAAAQSSRPKACRNHWLRTGTATILCRITRAAPHPYDQD
jgi:hypothetical protein